MERKQKIRNEKQGKSLDGCKQILDLFSLSLFFSWSQKCQVELFVKL